MSRELVRELDDGALEEADDCELEAEDCELVEAPVSSCRKKAVSLRFDGPAEGVI